MNSFSVAEEIVNDLTAYHPVIIPFRDSVVNAIMTKFDEYNEEIRKDERQQVELHLS